MLNSINNYVNEYINDNMKSDRIAQLTQLDQLDQLDQLFVILCEKYSGEMANEPNNINWIKFILLDRFGYNPMERHEDVKKLCVERDAQYKFRQNIVLRDKKCLVTGDNSSICEASHIIPFAESKSYDISNGLLLNACFHKMFDNYLCSINPNPNPNLNPNTNKCVLVFSPNFFELENFVHYLQYDKIELDIHENCRGNLQKHYKRFLEFWSVNYSH